MSAEIKAEIEKIGSAFHEFKKAQDAVDAKLSKGEEGSAELKQKVDRIENDLSSALDMKKRMEELEASTKRIADNVELAHKESKDKGVDLKVYGSALKKGALKKWQNVDWTEAEKKALAENVDPQGGYTVMPFMGDITSIIFESSPVRSLASSVTIGTNLYVGTLDDDEASAGWEGEGGARAETDTPDFGELNIKVHTQYAFPKASEEVLEDSSLDLASWLQMKVRDKFARLEATAFVSGDGVVKPRGFTTYTANTADPDGYVRGQIGTVTAAGATAITSDELVDLRTNLKAEYRPNAYFAFNRGTEGYIRKLKDGQGNYLWQPSYQMGVPDQLLGQRVVVFNDMADIATGAISVALGDFRSSYLIVDRLGMSVLQDPYTVKGKTGFYMRRRLGAGIQNFDSLKLLKQA